MSNKEAVILIVVQLFIIISTGCIFYTVIRMSGVSLSLEDIRDMKLCEIPSDSWFTYGVNLFMVCTVLFRRKR